MAIENAIASVAVSDLKAAIAWYHELLGKPPDSTPMPEVAEWRFPGGGWLQVYQLPERAGNCSFTLAVTDIEPMIAKVEKLGVNASERSSGPRVKTLMIVDPDGNHIAIAQSIDASMAH